MHFLLLGATGRTGRHVVSELLSQGHTAVALVRDPGSLGPRPGLTQVTGSPLSKADIEAALSAAPSPTTTTPTTTPCDAAIITLNANRVSESPFAAPLTPPRFLADSAANACEVLEAAGVRRVVVMSTVGAGDSWPNLPLLSKAFMGWTNVRFALEDHDLLDREVRLTGMDWTLVRASRLVFDDPGQPARAGAGAGAGGAGGVGDVRTLPGDGVGMGVADSVRVSSAARFMVKVAVEGLFVKSAVVIRD
ncbi:NAD(P)-binding protein [Colletotrichum falcatum]|nr:NAD(P)-binding protein [Colletotrichum falcatum]